MKTGKVKTALITGGASGMGRVIAQTLARMEIDVYIADIDEKGAGETAAEIQTRGFKANSYCVDVADSESVRTLFQNLRQEADSIDLLVHTAAVMGGTAFLEQITDEDWRRLISVNLDGTFFCCREAVKWMIEKGGGRIILFSSVASLTPTPGAIGYSAAKGGVNMLAKSLAVEAAKHNIRVNVIAPGYIDTPMLDSLPEGFREYIIKKTPLKRLGETEEAAGLAAFLAGPESDFFTGQVFSPNGGLVI